jgi:predicted phosphodiesterase
MTRILVFSDIHGAVPALEALAEIERSNFDAVVVAGDIGPRPTGFFRALEPLGCPVF